MHPDFRKILFLITLHVIAFRVAAQNVGINTTIPQATLDVRGNMRLGGLNKSISYDSFSGKINWYNSRLFAPSNHHLIRHSDSGEGLFYNDSALEYRNQSGNPVFSTNWNTGTAYFNGKIGIGTMNPAVKLHIQDGVSGVPPYYSNMILESGSNNHLSFYTPDNFESAVIFHKPSHLISGGIYYNSASTPDGFILRANNASRMYISNNGNVGIGGFPHTKLHVFDGASGYTDTYYPGITLEGNGNRYLNIIIPAGNLNGLRLRNVGIEAVGFVYDSPANPNSLQFRTAAYRTKMLLDANGRLGIGNLDPGYILDVNERMRLRNGGPNNSAGITLNNNSNIIAAFMGMDDNTYVGFVGTAAASKFLMNVYTGSLKLNGTEGTTGQIITSTGNGPAEWRSPSKFIYDNTVMKIQNSDLSLSNSTSPVAIPDLTHTFTVGGPTKVILSFTLNVSAQSCFACGPSLIFVDVQLNGAFYTQFYQHLNNSWQKIMRAEFVIPVSAGTHTIRLMGRATGPVVNFEGTDSFPGNMILEMVPE